MSKILQNNHLTDNYIDKSILTGLISNKTIKITDNLTGEISNKTILVFNYFVVEIQHNPNNLSDNKTTLIFRRTSNNEQIKIINSIFETDDDIFNDPLIFSPDQFLHHIKRIKNKIDLGENNLLDLYNWLLQHK
jgi:hypothetical protein